MLLDRFHRFSRHKEPKSKEEVMVREDRNECCQVSVASFPGQSLQGLDGGVGQYDGVEDDGDADMISIDTDVHTPMPTTPLPTTPITGNSMYLGQFKNNNLSSNNIDFGIQPPHMYMQRQGSVSSLASSVSDFHGGFFRQQVVASAAVNGAGTFTLQFLNLLMEIYQNTCSDPTVTPFDTCNPPSGILNTVAKIAIKESKNKNIEVGYERNSWLLTLVRHRLLEEIRKDNYYSRNSSNVSLPPPPPHFIELALNSSNVTNNQQDYFSSKQPSQEHYSSMINRTNSLIRSKSNSSQLLLARKRSNSNNLFSLTPTSSENNPQNFISRQRSNSALANIDDSNVSESLRKKRESLLMKR